MDNNIEINFVKDFDYFLSAVTFKLPNGTEGYAMVKNGIITMVKAFGKGEVTFSEEAQIRRKLEKYIDKLLHASKITG